MRAHYLLFILLSATCAKSYAKIDARGKYTPAYTPTEFFEDIYMGEPFLTQ